MILDKPLLEKAHDVTTGDRNHDYGHPLTDFLRQAIMLSAYHGRLHTPLDVAANMTLMKQARQANRFKTDSVLDTVGYQNTIEMMDDRIKELGYGFGVREFDSVACTMGFLWTLFQKSLERDQEEKNAV